MAIIGAEDMVVKNNSTVLLLFTNSPGRKRQWNEMTMHVEYANLH